MTLTFGKRFGLLAVAVALAACFGCDRKNSEGKGSAASGSSAEAGAKANAPAEQKMYVIGLVAKSESNPVFIAARVGAEDAAREIGQERGVRIRIDWRTPISEDAQKQAEIVEQMTGRGVDGIAISCSDASKVVLPINDAVSKGIPVVCFDSDCPQSKRFAYYGTDDFAAGQEVGKELARVMGDQGVVAILAGNPDAPNLQTRVRGVKDELARHEGIRVLDTFYHTETAPDAIAKMEQVQSANPQVTGWALVGGWPLNTSNALNNIAPHAKVVSIDALRPMLEYVKNGQVQVLLGQKVYEWGYESVRLLADKLIDGKAPADPVIKADLVRVTAENADEYGKNWAKWLGEK